MMKARSKVPPEVSNARWVSQVVAHAELGNHAFFQTLPLSLRRKLTSSARLSSRIHDLLVAEFGAALNESPACRNFFAVTDEKLECAILCLGVSYDLALRGAALEGNVLASFREICSEATLDNALIYAADLSLPRADPQASMPDRSQLLANGWGLLGIWAEANGVDLRWRMSSRWSATRVSLSVSRASACHLVTRVLQELSTTVEQS